MPIQVFSFFSGVGFLDLGFQNAGFNIEFVDEINKQFLQAYRYARRNVTNVPQYGYSSMDVKEFLDDRVWDRLFPNYNQRNNEIIGFIGGPPCPDFSVAGKNQGEKGANGHLTSVYTSIIVKRKPDFFVLENVKGLYRTKKHREFYNRIKKKLYNSGYSLFDNIVNALEYGVPQNRERLILIGFKRKRFGKRLNYSFGNHKVFSMEDIRKANWPTISPYMENGVLNKPKNIIEELTVEHWFERNDVNNHANQNDIFEVINNERYGNVQEGNIKGKSFKRLHRWRYSPTAAYGNNEVHLHPYLPRRISVAEALAIQSLPEWFELPQELSLSSKFKVVGNGVPFLLSLGVARELYEWIEDHA